MVGLIFKHYTNKDPSWLIVVMTVVPDTDFIFQTLLLKVKAPYIIYHGDFHNILIMMSFSLVVGWIVSNYGITFRDGFICSCLGMCAHYVEDYVAYPPAYAYFYPFSTVEFGIDLIPETRNLIVAGAEVMAIGVVLLAGAIIIRKFYDPDWNLDNYFKDWVSSNRKFVHAIKLAIVADIK